MSTLSTGARRRLLGALALFCIALQFGGSLPLSGVALVLWVGALALLEPAPLRRLWMPKFWIFSLVLALASGLLLGKQRDLVLMGVALSRRGLEAGLLMVVRGAFIFALSAWASRLLVSDEVQHALRRLGFARLGTALGIAFGLLPELSVRLRSATRGPGTGRRKLLGKAGYEAALDLICHTAEVATALAADPTKGARSSSEASEPRARTAPRPLATLAAVVGPPGSGKTRALHHLAERLRAAGFEVGGVTQPAVHDGTERIGYRLRDLATGEEIPFARRGEGPNGLRFQFDEAGWTWAGGRMEHARSRCDVLVVDELGRLEARGEGHLATLLSAPSVSEEARLWLLAVREDCAEQLAARLGAFAFALPSEADPAALDRFAQVLCERLAVSPVSPLPPPTGALDEAPPDRPPPGHDCVRTIRR